MNAEVRAVLSAQETRRRAAAYRLLSRLFLDEIPLEIIEQFRKSNCEKRSAEYIAEDARIYKRSDIAAAFTQALERADAEQVRRGAAAEFAAVLWNMAAESVCPYESVYTSPAGILMQDARDQVVAAYYNAGFECLSGTTNIPEDHVGIELGFMALLCEREAEALIVEDWRCAGKVKGIQRKFSEAHLFNWVPRMCDDLALCTEERRSNEDNETMVLPSIYNVLARTTKAFLQEESAYLST